MDYNNQNGENQEQNANSSEQQNNQNNNQNQGNPYGQTGSNWQNQSDQNQGNPYGQQQNQNGQWQNQNNQWQNQNGQWQNQYNQYQGYQDPNGYSPNGMKPIPENRSRLFIILSVLEILFCGGIFGLISLIISCMGSNSYNRGNFGDYESKHRTSGILLIVGLVIGIIANIAVVRMMPTYEEILNNLTDESTYVENPADSADSSWVSEYPYDDSEESSEAYMQLGRNFLIVMGSSGYELEDQTEAYGDDTMKPYFVATSDEATAIYIGLPDEEQAEEIFENLLNEFDETTLKSNGTYVAERNGMYYALFKSGSDGVYIGIGSTLDDAMAPLQLLG